MTAIKSLEKKVPIKFSFTQNQKEIDLLKENSCPHPYKLKKDGYNHLKNGNIQRYKCKVCTSRLGTKKTVQDFQKYMKKIKKIVHDLFILGFPLSGVAKRYGIPQPKLSTFKKQVIREAYSQNRDLLEHPCHRLPGGIMFGDETFFGNKKNYNSEVAFVSNDFKILAAGPVEKENLEQYIKDVFFGIDNSLLKQLKVFISDGEKAYKKLMRMLNKNIIHIQQIHDPRERGTIFINKYERLGPHLLHYQIKTNWKAFNGGKKELVLEWSIKLIRKKIFHGRGRPTKDQIQSAWRQLCGSRWRQKYEIYKFYKTKQEGTAKVFVNPETNKISLRAGSSKWMKDLLIVVLKIFNGKCVTSNMVEGKHSQVKGKGNLRKQQDIVYQHQEFVFNAYVAEHGHLPPITLHGRYLWKYLVKPKKKEKKAYDLWSNGTQFAQLSLMAFITS